MKKNGDDMVHTLVGIVSFGIGACDQVTPSHQFDLFRAPHSLFSSIHRQGKQEPDVYMKVSHYWEWMKKKIIQNGGMGACGEFKLTADPQLGIYL